MPQKGVKVIAQNRRARHDYFVLETWEAGTKDDAMVWSYGAMSCEKFEGEFGIDPESYAEKVGMEHLCLSRWPSMG